jgi:hypothetical protein
VVRKIPWITMTLSLSPSALFESPGIAVSGLPAAAGEQRGVRKRLSEL